MIYAIEYYTERDVHCTTVYQVIRIKLTCLENYTVCKILCKTLFHHVKVKKRNNGYIECRLLSFCIFEGYWSCMSSY